MWAIKFRPSRSYAGTVKRFNILQTSHCHWHWCQTNWTYHFSPHYFNGVKFITIFKCIFEETVPQLSVGLHFGNHISQVCHKNQYPGTVCNFGFIETKYSDKCWSDLCARSICLLGAHRSTVRRLFKKITQPCETYEPTDCCVRKNTQLVYNFTQVV